LVVVALAAVALAEVGNNYLKRYYPIV